MIQQAQTLVSVNRVLRFLAGFGIIYGLLGTICFVSQVRIPAWQFWWALATNGRLLDLGQFASPLIIQAASIWLVFGCIRLLQAKPRARGILFVWAIFVLTFELVYEACLVRRQIQTIRPGYGLLILRSSTQWAIGLGYPVMLLWILNLPDIVRALGTVRAFEVVPLAEAKESRRTARDGPEEQMRPGGVEALSTSTLHRDLERCVGWIGLAFGMLALVSLAVEVMYRGLPWNSGTRQYRIMNTLENAIGLSYALLLLGALLMIKGRGAGRVLVITWAGLYLVLTLGLASIVEFSYVTATSRPWVQSTPELIANDLYSQLHPAAFAILAGYILSRRWLARQI